MREQGQIDATENNSPPVAGFKDGESECGRPPEAEKG